MWLIALLIVLFVLTAGGGLWGQSRYGHYRSWSPAAVLVVVAVALVLSGHITLK